MNKPALLAAVTAGLVVGAVLGVYAPRWFASGAGAAGGCVHAGARRPVAQRVQVAAVRQCLSRAASRPWAACARTSPVLLRPEVAGRIQSIDFRKGSPWRAGEALVRLDDSVPRAELAQARANLTLAQTHYRRAVELQGKGFVSQKARDESASSLKVQSRRGAGAGAPGQDDHHRALSGIAGLRSVSVGDYVSQGQDLAPLEAIDPLKVDFRVPEMYLNKVGVGQQLTLRMDALPGEDRPGLVYAVSPLVDAGGRSILLRATVANRDAVLRPGMFARVQLQFAQDQALVVPEAALTPSGQAQYVYRVRDGVAERRAVTIGERREGLVEILTGVGEGDQLVVAGLQRVTDGAPVQIVGDGA